jgi:translation initiation factor 2 subunit 2
LRSRPCPFLPPPFQDAIDEDAEPAAAAAAEPIAPDDFSDLKKKKKKSSKKAAFDLEAFERELKEEEAAGGAGEDGEGGDVPDYKENELGEDVFGGGGAAGGDEPKGDGDEHQAWIGSDREYTYEEVRFILFHTYTFLLD